MKDWPIFGRDVAGVAWRPPGDALTSTRLGRFIAATGERDLEALQRHAEADPAWFWGAAADDLGLAWQRKPSAILDISEGKEWSRWWSAAPSTTRLPRSARAPTRDLTSRP
jgi:acetyl-CoA synthetase